MEFSALVDDVICTRKNIMAKAVAELNVNLFLCLLHHVHSSKGHKCFIIQ